MVPAIMVFSVSNRAPADRRGAVRTECFLDAMVLPGRQACIAVDRSATGFKLKFHRPYDGQRKIILLLTASGEAYAADVMWMRDREVGVLITAQTDLRGLVPKTFAEARQVWTSLKASGAFGVAGSNDR